MSTGQSSSHHTPRDAKVMAAILKDVGVDDYEPRVINQMLEFAYRYVSDVLDDARIYSEFSNKKSVDADDVRLAVQMKVENTLTNPPPREMLSELAQEKNAIPLPALKQQYGLRLPPDRYCTLQPNFRLKTAPPTAAAVVGARTGSISSTTTPSIGSQPPQFRTSTQQPRPKPTSSPSGSTVKKPAAGGNGDQGGQISTPSVASKPMPAPQSKPLFRIVGGTPGSSAPRPPTTTTTTSGVTQSEMSPTTTTATTGGGVKRKLEPLDEDYDQI